MREDNKRSSAPSVPIRETNGPNSASRFSATEPAGHSVASSDLAEVEEGGDAPQVSSDMHQLIGRHLRAVYDDIAKQPIPDRFLELMTQLDNKKRAG